MEIDPLLTLACLCWFAFIGAWIAVAAFERRRVAAKAARLRENRAGIESAWREWRKRDVAVSDEDERGRE